MTSRLLRRLDAAIAAASSPVEAACLGAERVVVLARRGLQDQARAELDQVRQRFGRATHPAVTGWLCLAEGLLNHFADVSGGAFDRLQRAHALAGAARLQPLRALAAAWLAHAHYVQSDDAQMVRLLAEALQTAAIVLSDQFMGQSRAIIDPPDDAAGGARRETTAAGAPDYKRYRDTPSGVAPMAIPGTPGVTYTADGLEHTEAGVPSSQSRDHRVQLDKRERKLALYDYGPRWADIEGEGATAVITFGSASGPVREAVQRAAAQGLAVRLIALRLLAPLQVQQLEAALDGVRQVLVVEQNHGAQLFRYLRSMMDLPVRKASFHRPGPLPLRPGDLAAWIVEQASALEGVSA